jgi:hypothetical protein
VVRGQATLGIVFYPWLPTEAATISVISIAALRPQSEAMSFNGP